MHWRRGDVALAALLVAAPWLWFPLRYTSPLFELVAVLLPLLVVVTVIALVTLVIVARWRLRFLVVAASVLAVGAVAVVLPWRPFDTGHPADGVTIAVANVLSSNTSPDAVAADIIRQSADIVVVPEARGRIHDLLAAAYPHELRGDRRDAAIGVYSRFPISAPRFVPGLLDSARQIRVEVEGPHGRFVLWAVHLPKPWLVASGGYEMRPLGHAHKIDAFLRAFSKETLPLVVAGDTNLTDRGRGYHLMTRRFDDAMRGIWGGPTSRKTYLRPLLLRIDHVFVPTGWCADRAHRFTLTGSDHRGVSVRVGACAS